jgi:DNA-binding CsgD family transcriptional regulator
MDDERFDRLTKGQRECLRLVYARLEIKQIARELRIAVPTVNQRLAAARRTLGASRSLDAARMLAEHEGPDLYIRPIYPQIGLDPEAEPANESDVGEAHEENTPATEGRATDTGFAWPFATKGRPRNDLNVTQRLAWAVVIAAGSMIAFGIWISALDALSHLL